MDNQTIAKRIAETTAPPSVIDAVTELIAENTRLEYQNHRMGMEIAENSIRFLVFNEVAAERDALRAENERLTDIIAGAKETILDWGGIDGGHHKQWTLDQTLHHLTCDDYNAVIAEYEAGEDGPNTYKWDKGIAP